MVLMKYRCFEKEFTAIARKLFSKRDWLDIFKVPLLNLEDSHLSREKTSLMVTSHET